MIWISSCSVTSTVTILFAKWNSHKPSFPLIGKFFIKSFIALKLAVLIWTGVGKIFCGIAPLDFLRVLLFQIVDRKQCVRFSLQKTLLRVFSILSICRQHFLSGETSASEAHCCSGVQGSFVVAIGILPLVLRGTSE